ncbi:MAG TPA: L-rhamnose mutarotase [Chitinophagaceae bacterium]
MVKYLFCFLIVFAGCKQHTADKKEIDSGVTTPEKQRVRYGMVTGLKPEKLDYYKELHAKPWPAVIAKIKECNIENYSIYIQKMEDKYYLFSYFEYTGHDFDTDMKKMATDTTTQRWWKETDPCQLPLPEALSKQQVWTKMDELFYTN